MWRSSQGPPRRRAPAHTTLSQGLVSAAPRTSYVTAAFLPAAAVVDVLDFFFGRSQPGSSSAELQAWSRQIQAKRGDENRVWASDPRVATLIRLWNGVWERPRGEGSTGDEVLVTYGYGVDHSRRTREGPLGILRGKQGELMVLLRPVVGGAPLPEIAATVTAPR